MKKLNNTGDILEYLSMFPKGKIKEFYPRIDKEMIKSLESSPCFKISGEEYEFTQEGIKYYNEYYENSGNDSGLLGRILSLI